MSANSIITLVIAGAMLLFPVGLLVYVIGMAIDAGDIARR